MHFLLQLWSFILQLYHSSKVKCRELKHPMALAGKIRATIFSDPHYEGKQLLCLSVLAGCRPAQGLIVLCSSSIHKKNVHCTLTEQHRFCHCAVMDCWWLRPSAQPKEDTERAARRGWRTGVFTWLYFRNSGWIHKGDIGHSTHKPKKWWQRERVDGFEEE